MLLVVGCSSDTRPGGDAPDAGGTPPVVPQGTADSSVAPSDLPREALPGSPDPAAVTHLMAGTIVERLSAPGADETADEVSYLLRGDPTYPEAILSIPDELPVICSGGEVRPPLGSDDLPIPVRVALGGTNDSLPLEHRVKGIEQQDC